MLRKHKIDILMIYLLLFSLLINILLTSNYFPLFQNICLSIPICGRTTIVFVGSLRCFCLLPGSNYFCLYLELFLSVPWVVFVCALGCFCVHALRWGLRLVRRLAVRCLLVRVVGA